MADALHDEKPRTHTGMIATTIAGPALTLGRFLRDRRARLVPFDNLARRRTPGLRREEVAARADVSVTWYTWLEQGRGGPPSSEVLERLAAALELDAAAREVLFLLAQQRPPPIRSVAAAAVPATVQHVLDAMPTCPAYVKTPVWDVVAWNAAGAAVLHDWAVAPIAERNTLRRVFSDPRLRVSLPDWEVSARFVLAVFRVDVARFGDCPEADALVTELYATNADFRRLWAENELRTHGVGVKRIHHPLVGFLTLEYSAFAVDGEDGLSMHVFTPASPADALAIATLVATRESTLTAG